MERGNSRAATDELRKMGIQANIEVIHLDVDSDSSIIATESVSELVTDGWTFCSHQQRRHRGRFPLFSPRLLCFYLQHQHCLCYLSNNCISSPIEIIVAVTLHHRHLVPRALPSPFPLSVSSHLHAASPTASARPR